MNRKILKQFCLTTVLFLSMSTVVNGSTAINGIYKNKPIVKVFMEDKEWIPTDVPAYIENGKTMVPLQFLRDNGFDVTWHPKLFMVDIYEKKPEYEINRENIVSVLKFYSEINDYYYQLYLHTWGIYLDRYNFIERDFSALIQDPNFVSKREYIFDVEDTYLRLTDLAQTLIQKDEGFKLNVTENISNSLIILELTHRQYQLIVNKLYSLTPNMTEEEHSEFKTQLSKLHENIFKLDMNIIINMEQFFEKIQKIE